MVDTIELAESGWVPDPLIRAGIRRLLRARLKAERLQNADEQYARFRERISDLAQGDVAIHTDAANEQHYEVPPDFFALCLGAHRKYSCGYWDQHTSTLDDSETRMLRLTAERARLRDGDRILELGCGWPNTTLPQRYSVSPTLPHSDKRSWRWPGRGGSPISRSSRPICVTSMPVRHSIGSSRWRCSST